MTLRTWVLSHLHDPQKEAELDAREARTEEVASALREERERNGFGRLFAVDALDTKPYRAAHAHHRKGGGL